MRVKNPRSKEMGKVHLYHPSKEKFGSEDHVIFWVFDRCGRYIEIIKTYFGYLLPEVETIALFWSVASGPTVILPFRISGNSAEGKSDALSAARKSGLVPGTLGTSGPSTGSSTTAPMLPRRRTSDVFHLLGLVS